MLTLRGHSFFPGPLGAGSTVIDLGAHRGEFSAQVRARFGCRCIAVEANPNLIEHVRKVEGVQAHGCALAGADGEMTLHYSANPEASSIKAGPMDATGDSAVVPARSLASLLAEAGVTRVDLLKVDIEGAEVEMFDSLSDDELCRIDQITIEWHDFSGAVSADEIARIAGRLDRVGFEAFRFGADNMNWLFARRDAPGLGRLRRKYVQLFVRPARGLLHAFRRSTGVQVGLSNE
ncbi:MAG TPA: FkbM family methyltransferase [Tepidisphaeraceae bacterium]|nr:FkbM family methyltransferase [Tepidisphaeraceae bacterium]